MVSHTLVSTALSWKKILSLWTCFHSKDIFLCCEQYSLQFLWMSKWNDAWSMAFLSNCGTETMLYHTQSILIQFHWEVSHRQICNNCWSWPLALNSITYQACSVECEEDTEDLATAQLTSNHRLKSNLTNISISKENSLWAFGQVCFSIGGFE